MQSHRPLALVVLLVGCSYSRFASPHQAYTPLLDHEGQLDIAASAGGMEQMVSTASARIGYSPVRNFEIVGGYDGDLQTDAGNPTEHHAASLGLGTYVHDPILRLEALAVVGAGYAWGDALQGGGSASNYSLRGTYVQPSLQFAIGFEIPYFEFAGGVRLMAEFADVQYARRASSSPPPSGLTDGSTSYGSLIVDHFITVRVPIDVFRFEVTAGWADVFFGANSIASELPSRAYVTGGIGFQFDTMPVTPYVDDEPAPPEMIGTPVIVESTSGPAVVEQPAVVIVPPPPS